MTLQQGHTSTKGDNTDLKKHVSIIFDKESIYENQNFILKGTASLMISMFYQKELYEP